MRGYLAVDKTLPQRQIQLGYLPPARLSPMTEKKKKDGICTLVKFSRELSEALWEI